MNLYAARVLENLKRDNPHEPEFIQSVTEVLNSLAMLLDREGKYEKNNAAWSFGDYFCHAFFPLWMCGCE